MRTVTAYATPSAKAPFEKTQIERREVGPKDVLIKIAFAGICHSDIHTGRNEWGEAHFPLVPGHEIAGTVEEVGSDVTKYQVGDRVGVGCMVDSCGECENCTAGEEQFCLKGNVGTYNAQDYHHDNAWTDGGYSTHIVVTEDFVLRMPPNLPPAAATQGVETQTQETATTRATQPAQTGPATTTATPPSPPDSAPAH